MDTQHDWHRFPEIRSKKKVSSKITPTHLQLGWNACDSRGLHRRRKDESDSSDSSDDKKKAKQSAVWGTRSQKAAKRRVQYFPGLLKRYILRFLMATSHLGLRPVGNILPLHLNLTCKRSITRQGATSCSFGWLGATSTCVLMCLFCFSVSLNKDSVLLEGAPH